LNPWIALLSPFAVGLVIVGGIKACEAYAKWRDRKAMRVRDANLRKWGMVSERTAGALRL